MTLEKLHQLISALLTLSSNESKDLRKVFGDPAAPDNRWDGSTVCAFFGRDTRTNRPQIDAYIRRYKGEDEMANGGGFNVVDEMDLMEG